MSQPREQSFETSPYSTKDKVRRVLWMLVGQPVFRLTFHNWYSLRAVWLRMFGMTIGKGVRLRSTVRIEQPWNIALGDGVIVGDRAILYALGPITVGDRTMISQMAHLCAGTHDHTQPGMPLKRQPVAIGSDTWIAADAFIGPNVTIGDRTVVGARAVVMKSLGDDVIAIGHPARAVGRRVMSAVGAEEGTG